MLKTSKQWNEIYKEIILDPDGWNRKNYEYSFNVEEITENEFKRRLSLSTRRFSVSLPRNEDNQPRLGM